jgi:enoyl-[acyl-carrier-protein] reductase (NADH)
MEDVVGATLFLLDNKGTSGTNIYVDRGWRLT